MPLQKVLTYLWPNRQAHASGALPRWRPWLHWPSLGSVPSIPEKTFAFCRFQNHFTFVNY